MTARIRSMLIWASPALPFQMRQCSRSTSSTITGVGEVTPQARAAVGEGGQCRVPGVPSGVETAADQCLEVGIGFGDGAENLAATSLHFDVADPHLQVPLAVLAAADKRRIQGHNDRRSRRFRPDCSVLTQSLADFQGMAAQGPMTLSHVDRKYLPQHIRGRPVGHQGAEMRLKPVQFGCRSAMRRPSKASLHPARRGAAEAGKPHRDPAEQRRDRMVPGLRGDDHLLNTRQQPLRVGQGQTQISDIAEVIGPVDLHDVHARPRALNPDLHQPQHPSQASTLGQGTNAKIATWPPHPQSCGGPLARGG